MDKPTYSWSFDEETYHGHFGSIDEAIKAAFDREVRGGSDAGELPLGVHIGECEPFQPANHLGADAFIDWAQQQMCEELGEQSEDFLASVSAVERLELDAFLEGWIGRVDAGSSYWKINNSAFHRFADYGLSQDAA
ncbi:hypothetical protein [Stenotrophomonas sp.]|uniref:hypothetical protein n=1 Tax=Stenotrophomonas sp. TaxID=69392 RepID=UPI0028AAE753|nr:hypothetical protein [Stenotrophomonas sp.]